MKPAGSLRDAISLLSSKEQFAAVQDWSHVRRINRLVAAIRDVRRADEAYRILRAGQAHDSVSRAIKDAEALIRLSDRLPAESVRAVAQSIVAAIENVADIQSGPMTARWHLANLVELHLVPQREIAEALSADRNCPIDERDVRRLDRQSLPALDPATRKLLKRNWPTIRRVAGIARG